MKPFGLLVLANVVMVAGYALFFGSADKGKVIAFAGIGLLAGFGLLMGDRLKSVKVEGIGEITAEAQQRAVAGAEAIEAIQKEVEKHRDSIAMIVRDANGARDEIKRIDEIAKTAKKKGDEVETVVEKATKAQTDLTETAEFNLLLTRVNNDDRAAFERLFEINRTGKEPFRSLASQALINVASHMVGGLVLGMDEAGWKVYQFDPQKASLKEYSAFISGGVRPDVVADALSKLWEQERFSKRERIVFLVEMLEKASSVHVLHRTTSLLNIEAKINRNLLAWREYAEWWRKNGENYQ